MSLPPLPFPFPRLAGRSHPPHPLRPAACSPVCLLPPLVPPEVPPIPPAAPRRWARLELFDLLALICANVGPVLYGVSTGDPSTRLESPVPAEDFAREENGKLLVLFVSSMALLFFPLVRLSSAFHRTLCWRAHWGHDEVQVLDPAARLRRVLLVTGYVLFTIPCFACVIQYAVQSDPQRQDHGTGLVANFIAAMVRTAPVVMEDVSDILSSSIARDACHQIVDARLVEGSEWQDQWAGDLGIEAFLGGSEEGLLGGAQTAEMDFDSAFFEVIASTDKSVLVLVSDRCIVDFMAHSLELKAIIASVCMAGVAFLHYLASRRDGVVNKYVHLFTDLVFTAAHFDDSGDLKVDPPNMDDAVAVPLDVSIERVSDFIVVMLRVAFQRSGALRNMMRAARAENPHEIALMELFGGPTGNDPTIPQQPGARGHSQAGIRRKNNNVKAITRSQSRAGSVTRPKRAKSTTRAEGMPLSDVVPQRAKDLEGNPQASGAVPPGPWALGGAQAPSASALESSFFKQEGRHTPLMGREAQANGRRASLVGSRAERLSAEGSGDNPDSTLQEPMGGSGEGAFDVQMRKLGTLQFDVLALPPGTATKCVRKMFYNCDLVCTCDGSGELGVSGFEGDLRKARRSLSGAVASGKGGRKSVEALQQHLPIDGLEGRTTSFHGRKASQGRLSTGAASVAGKACTCDGLVDAETLDRFLALMEKSYLDNPYHRWEHAVDVTHTMYVLLQSIPWLLARSPGGKLDVFCILVAAVTHDVGHRGVSNRHLVETNDVLALTYNDSSPQESMHISTLFHLCQRYPDCNIFNLLNSADYRYARKLVIELVLDTDMSRHARLVSDVESLHIRLLSQHQEFKNKAASKSGVGRGPSLKGRHEGESHRPARVMPISNVTEGMALIEEGLEDVGGVDVSMLIEDPADLRLLLRALIHIADLGHAWKPSYIHAKWSYRAIVEFFNEGTEQKELGMNPLPMMDRAQCYVPLSQADFLNLVIAPFVGVLTSLVPSLVDLKIREAVLLNYSMWIATARGDGQVELVESASANFVSESGVLQESRSGFRKSIDGLLNFMGSRHTAGGGNGSPSVTLGAGKEGVLTGRASGGFAPRAHRSRGSIATAVSVVHLSGMTRPSRKDLFIHPLTPAELAGAYYDGLAGCARARASGGRALCGLPPGAFADSPEDAVGLLQTINAVVLMGTGQDTVDRRNIDVTKNECIIREVLRMGRKAPGVSTLASGSHFPSGHGLNCGGIVRGGVRENRHQTAARDRHAQGP